MSKAKVSILAGLTAVTVLLAGCSGKQGAMGSMGGGEKVATVDGTVITKGDYDKTYNEFKRVFGLERMPEQQRVMLADTVNQMALNKLILHTLVYNEAQKSGIAVSDADVQEYKQKKIFSDPNLKGQYKTFLEQNMLSEADFDAMVKENLLLNKFMDVKGGQAVQVSDAEVKAYYDKNTEQFKIPARVHAAHILVKAIVPQMKQEMRAKNPKISDTDLDKQINAEKTQAKAKADKLFAEVKAAPAKFADIAKTNSDDVASARNGGDLGYMVESNIDPAFWAAVEKTPNGQMYPGVLPTQFGYHIIKVLDHQAPKQENFMEAKGFIKEQLGQQKKQEFLKKWAESKKSEAKIVIEPQYMPKAAPAGAGQAGGMMQQPQAAAPQQQAKQ